MENNMSDRSVEESVHTIFEFYRRTRKIARKIEYYRDKSISDLPITGAQLYGLWSIYTLDSCTITQLADYSGLAKSSVTTLIKSLQKNGYIIAHHDLTDGRVTKVFLSKEGLNIIRKLNEEIVEVNPRFSNLVDVMAERLKYGDATYQQISTFLKLK